MGKSLEIHGRDHRPGGADPIPFTAIDLVLVGAGASRPYTAPQAIPTGFGVTAVTLTVEDFDTEDIFDVGQPTRLTIQRPGVWLFTGSAQFVTNATGGRQVQIRKNGTTTVLQSASAPPPDIYWAGSIVVYASAEAGDYFELVVSQTSGGNLDTGNCFLTCAAQATALEAMARSHASARFRAAAAWSADRIGIWTPWLVFLALLLLVMWTSSPTETGAQ